MLGKEHKAPGINYRQVWARMVSQLIVKSEVGLHWGGKTIWLVQDVLVNYICSSTALDIKRFLAEHTGEVNMLSFRFGAEAGGKQESSNSASRGSTQARCQLTKMVLWLELAFKICFAHP